MFERMCDGKLEQRLLPLGLSIQGRYSLENWIVLERLLSQSRRRTVRFVTRYDHYEG